MRLALLATVDNPHVIRWIQFLVRQPEISLHVLCDVPVKTRPEDVAIVHPEMNLLTKIVAFKLFPGPLGNNVFKFLPYRKELRRIKPDIIHGIEVLGYGAAAVLSGMDIPTVVTPMGNDIFEWPERSRIAHYLVRLSLKKADIITTNMPNLADFLHQRFHIPAEKVRAFSWGVDTEIFHPGYEDEVRKLREQLRIPDGAAVVISNRQMQKYWGIENVVRSAPLILKNSSRPVYFIFLRGSGSLEFEDAMKDLCTQIGIRENTRFIGEFITPEQMAVYLNCADVFISLPRSDLLSISVLEGMACGCTPILANLPAYHTRITHGENGFLVPPDAHDVIAEYAVRAMEDPDIRRQFAARNVEIIKEHDSWSHNAHHMLEIYKALLRA